MAVGVGGLCEFGLAARSVRFRVGVAALPAHLLFGGWWWLCVHGVGGGQRRRDCHGLLRWGGAVALALW